MSEQQPQKPVPAPFSPEDMARRRRRSIALALVLGGLVIFFFVVMPMNNRKLSGSIYSRFPRPCAAAPGMWEYRLVSVKPSTPSRQPRRALPPARDPVRQAR